MRADGRNGSVKLQCGVTVYLPFFFLQIAMAQAALTQGSEDLTRQSKLTCDS